YYVDLNPNNQFDWPITASKKLKSETWINNLLESTLAPIGVQAPFTVPDFNLKYKKPYIITEISSAINAAPPTKPPISLDNPNPARKRILAQTWIQTRQFFYQDIKPFKQDNYPNPPAQRLKIPNTWISNRKIDEPEQLFMPCSVLDFPNPSAKRKIALTHLGQISLFQQIFTKPTGSSIIAPHVLRVERETLTWIQTRPFYYNEPLTIPFKNVDFNIARRRKDQVQTHLARFNLTSTPGSPFSQKDWPNPARKARLRESWEFYYQLDDNQPFINQITNNPVIRKAISPFTWIFRSQTGEETPLINISSPNPVILKRQTNSWILNLLQSTLNPGVGAIPFNQNDYPNPLRGKRNFHSGITFNKPTYYTEEPLQIAQYDWPIFRAIKRNPVGYILTTIPTDEQRPRVANIVDVPFTKEGVIPVWAYSSLQ